MKQLVRPSRLQPGDTVATVSLSAGLAGTPQLRWRYEQGKRRLQEVFGLRVVEMPHTLAPQDHVAAHPEARAADLMQAFADPQIKAVFSCIGGSDSIRLMPYIDYDVIAANPKIFCGYSDTTVNHLMCYKAGLASFYGPAVLTDFAENVAMSRYTVRAVRQSLFETAPVGNVPVAGAVIAPRSNWDEANKKLQRCYEPNAPYLLLQGRGTVRGRLIGGCFEVLSNLRGTELFPPAEDFDGAILFLETSEVHAPVWMIEDGLRALGAMGILQRLSGILWGRPQGGVLFEEYAAAIPAVLAEFGCTELPVLYNASFGHNEPKMILPYGALAEIDSEKCRFALLESGVV